MIFFFINSKNFKKKKHKRMIENSKFSINSVMGDNYDGGDMKILVHYDTSKKKYIYTDLSEKKQKNISGVDITGLVDNVKISKKNVIALRFITTKTPKHLIIYPSFRTITSDIKIISNELCIFEINDDVDNNFLVSNTKKIYIPYSISKNNGVNITYSAPILITEIFDPLYDFPQIFNAFLKLTPPITTTQIHLTSLMENIYTSDVISNSSEFIININDKNYNKRCNKLINNIKEYNIKNTNKNKIMLTPNRISEYTEYISNNFANIILKLDNFGEPITYKPYFEHSLLCVMSLSPKTTIKYSFTANPIKWIESDSNVIISNKAKIYKVNGSCLIEEYILKNEKRIANFIK